MNLKVWFMETRPSFLLLTPLVFSVGLAQAYVEGSFNVFRALLGLAGVMLAHLSVNVINDYFDYKSGLDLKTRRTPFSGGSGILPAGLLNPRDVYLFAVGCLILGGSIGVYFALTTGWMILPLVAVAAFTIYFYTTFLTHLFVGELFAGLNFGPLMVMGGYFIQTGRYSLSALIPSIVPGILVGTLLFLNEFPDVEADRTAGRRNAVISLGLARSSKVYGLLIASTYTWVVVCVLLRLMPGTMLITFVTLPFALRATRSVLKDYADIERLIPAMGANVMLVLSMTGTTTLGLLLSTLI
ncbi:prenyltransferase [Candidatus Bathyarchaeota archaeon]|nr:MAG: prenyltransferase [Candidatus Bathyarchaeota archaeon]